MSDRQETDAFDMDVHPKLAAVETVNASLRGALAQIKARIREGGFTALLDITDIVDQALKTEEFRK